jgi:hypothetical protein
MRIAEERLTSGLLDLALFLFYGRLMVNLSYCTSTSSREWGEKRKKKGKNEDEKEQSSFIVSASIPFLPSPPSFLPPFPFPS